jgi:hypothetical protein
MKRLPAIALLLLVSPAVVAADFPPDATGSPQHSYGTLALADGTSSPSAAKVDSTSQPQYRDVTCEGFYRHHLQGICVDNEAIYWSYTTTLVKTDLDGKVLKAIPVVSHHGDLCFHDGKVYVAVNLGKFNDPRGNANSWVYVYDAKTLEEIARHEVQEVSFTGRGGVDFATATSLSSGDCRMESKRTTSTNTIPISNSRRSTSFQVAILIRAFRPRHSPMIGGGLDATGVPLSFW